VQIAGDAPSLLIPYLKQSSCQLAQAVVGGVELLRLAEQLTVLQGQLRRIAGAMVPVHAICSHRTSTRAFFL
jgi:hypothetical protein